MPQLGDGSPFDLPNPLASQVEDLPHIGKSSGFTPVQAESHHQHLSFAFLQYAEGVDEMEASHDGRRVTKRVRSALIFNEILQFGVALFADGTVK